MEAALTVEGVNIGGASPAVGGRDDEEDRPELLLLD